MQRQREESSCRATGAFKEAYKDGRKAEARWVVREEEGGRKA
jgi:hypothetical protein